MDIDAFYFSEPHWLWGLLAIPLIWFAFLHFHRPSRTSKKLERMIDAHLLPYLLVNEKSSNKSTWKNKLLSWSIIWICLMLALAGPRWNFRDIEMMSTNQNLIILLDLSESMDATDVKPSRLVRARQKIEDLLQHSQGIKIGLIGFAADPHMITPLTEDKETIRLLLPSLGTDLVYVQGSRLSPALKMAAKMLEADHSQQQTIVIVSDGGFEDKNAIAEVAKLAQNGITVHTIGTGTVEGTILKDNKGNIVKKSGKAIIVKLERNTLQDIAKAGNGLYIEPYYSSHNELAILQNLKKNAETINTGKYMRLWDEGFMFFLLPALPFFLFWFRRGISLTVIAFAMTCPISCLTAGITEDYFLNSEQRGAKAFENEHFDTAAQEFQDPYRKGVCCYKAGQFAEAEKLFRQSTREEVACDAAYNLGNALTKQHKFKEAVTAYENVLKKWPDNESAKENLELVRKMLQQQQQEQQNKNKNDKQQQQNDDDQEEQKSDDSQNDQSDSDAEQNKQDDQTSNDDCNECEDDQPKSDNPNEEEKEEPQENQQPDEKNEEAPTPQPQSQPEQQQQDIDADAWLNRLSNDPKGFLKNKFYIESKKNETREGYNPW